MGQFPLSSPIRFSWVTGRNHPWSYRPTACVVSGTVLTRGTVPGQAGKAIRAIRPSVRSFRPARQSLTAHPIEMAPGIRHKKSARSIARHPNHGFIIIGQFASTWLALRNVRRKAVRSNAGSRSGPALMPYNSRNKPLTVWPDNSAASA